MTIHQFDPTDHPAIASVSRRAVVQRLGGESLMAASVSIAPKLVQAQEATPANNLEANTVLARRWHDRNLRARELGHRRRDPHPGLHLARTAEHAEPAGRHRGDQTGRHGGAGERTSMTWS